ncbi:MAG: S41 family peptidase [Myxococcota bacterium]
MIWLAVATLTVSGGDFDPGAAADRAMELLAQHYVDSGRLDAVLRELKRKRPDYLRLRRGAFVEAITTDLRRAGRDNHLYVRSVPKPRDPGFDAQWRAQERKDEKDSNFGFRRVEQLDGRIGYVQLVQFMEPARSVPTANAVMAFLANSEALIIDLRGNGGGYGGLPEYLASYFFDVEPTLLSTVYFDAERQSFAQTHSIPTIVGPRRVGIPLAVLVDGGTASAAEWLAYTLQAFDKAIIVGERSAGGAHMNTFYALGQGLRISISTAIPINPRTRSNWEQVGITPDVACSSEKALSCAIKALDGRR